MSLQNYSLRTRMFLAVSAALLLLVGVGALAALRVGAISETLAVVNDVNSAKQRFTINFRGSVHDRAIALRDVVLVGPAELPPVLDEIDRLTADYERSAGPLDALLAAHPDPEETRILRSIKEVEAETLPRISQVVTLRETGDLVRANAVLGEARSNFSLWLARINEFINHQESKNRLLGQEVRASAEGFTLLIGIAVAASIMIAVIVTLVVDVSITGPLGRMIAALDKLSRGEDDVAIPEIAGRSEVSRMAEALSRFRDSSDARRRAELDDRARRGAEAERARTEMLDAMVSGFGEVVQRAMNGDLSGRMQSSRADPALRALGDDLNRLMQTFDDALGEAVTVVGALSRGSLESRMSQRYAGKFGELASSVNATIAKLQEIIAEVAKSSGAIELAVDQVAANAGELSQSSNRQAAMLQENSATMEEITATVRSNADSAKNALALAREASARAIQGGDVVESTAKAMEKINDSSRQISDIVTVIDSIAFQTNLLALNAAVEAARAGEAGKGFAVVASEVRNLAQRSSDSARDIRLLIDVASSNVSSGVDLVSATDEALKKIVDSIAAVSAKVDEITSASVEQAIAVESVSKSTAELDRRTQENQARAARNSAAAEQLNQRSADLKRLLDFFSTDADAGARWRHAAE